MRRILTIANRGTLAWLALCSAYLLGLLAMASRTGRQPAQRADRPLRFVVLVPAHNEAEGIRETVAALVAQLYPSTHRRVVVIADNCTDATGDLAREAGAEVWKRDDRAQPGKGQAIAWALERVWSESPRPDAVAMVDADCVASLDLLSTLDRRLGAGAEVVQADYRVANPDESSAAARRWAGFALMHAIRGAGKSNAGLSCGLFGTGMAFRAKVLWDEPWSSFSITEDAEYHVRLIEAGYVTKFAPDCAVLSRMPVTEAAARDQQLRWESGNASLARRTVPHLFASGIRNHDLQRLHAVWEQLVPPQSILLLGIGASAFVSIVVADRRGFALAIGTGLMQSVYVVGGLVMARAPASVWRALLTAPVLMLQKVRQALIIASGRGPTEWVRTARASESE